MARKRQRAARSELDGALSDAVRILRYRDRTTVELRRHLAKRGVRSEIADRVVGLLQSQRLVDDVRFVSEYGWRKRRDGYARARIETDLRKLGIGRQDITLGLRRLDPADDLEAALAFLERRGVTCPLDDADRRRAWGMLVRRGHEAETADAALERIDSRAI